MQDQKHIPFWNVATLIKVKLEELCRKYLRENQTIIPKVGEL